MPNTELPSQRETIDAATCDYFNRFLAMNRASPEHREGRQIASQTVLCGDYSVDFNLVNGDKKGSPFLDVVLFDTDGVEVQTLPPMRIQLEGTYKFYDSVKDRELTLIIERGN